jgi:hypothetical protein
MSTATATRSRSIEPIFLQSRKASAWASTMTLCRTGGVHGRLPRIPCFALLPFGPIHDGPIHDGPIYDGL